MEKIEAYLKHHIAAKLIFLAVALRLPLVFMPENLEGEWGYLLIYFASILADSYIWLTLEKYFRQLLKVKSLSPIILTLVGFKFFQYTLAFQGVNILIPDWLYSLSVIGETGLFCVLAFYIWSVRGYEIPHQQNFAVVLFLIYFSKTSFLMFNGYPWHGVQLFISLTLFTLEILIAFYLYRILSWFENYPNKPEPAERLIPEIGSQSDR